MLEIRRRSALGCAWAMSVVGLSLSCAPESSGDGASPAPVELMARSEALTAAPACTLEELSWRTATTAAPAQVCAGPFQYGLVNIVDEACANGACTEAATCRHWDNGPDAQTAVKFSSYDQDGTCSCQEWGQLGAKTVCFEWADCFPLAADFAADRAACVREGTTFRDSVNSGLTVTWPGDRVRNENFSADLFDPQGGVSNNKTGAAKFSSQCQMVYKYVIPASKASEAACGCKTRKPTCPVTKPDTLHLTAPNVTIAAVPQAGRNAVCTTCQHLPLRDEADAQAMFDCLAGFAQNGLDESVKTEAARRAALVFERFGGALSAASYAQGLAYHQGRSGALACGTDPLGDFSCVADASTRNGLFACQRLTGSHVSSVVKDREFERCLGSIQQFQSQGAACGESQRSRVKELTDQFVGQYLGGLSWGTDDLGALRTALTRIDAWYRIAVAQESVAPEKAVDRMSPLLSTFWAAVYAGTVADLSDAKGGAALTDARLTTMLGDALGKRTDAQLAVLNAALSTTRPMSAPLVSVVGDALSPFVEGLLVRARLHDLSCRLKKCSGESEVSALYAALASVHSKESLTRALAAGGAALPSTLRTALSTLRDSHTRLQDAYAALPGAHGSLAGLVDQVAPRGAESLAATVQAARGARNSYDKTGFFSFSPDVLHFGIDDRVRTFMVNRVSTGLTNLERERNTYRSERQSLLRDLLNQIGNQQIADATERRAAQLYQRTEEDVSDLNGLRAQDAAEALRFADAGRAIHELFKRPGLEVLEFSTDTRQFSASGASARFDGRSFAKIDDIGLKSEGEVVKLTVPAQGRVRVEVSGQWSPTCAIKKEMPNSAVLPFGPNASDALTGPEGFWMEERDGRSRVKSRFSSQESYTRKERTSNKCTGMSGSLGAGGSYGIFTGSYTYTQSTDRCDAGARGSSTSEGTSDTSTSEQQHSATFHVGLRVNGTPFVKAPAGALLLVALPQGETSPDKIRDVVVAMPGRVVLFPEASDVYIVVNDRADCLDDHELSALDTTPLTVTTSVLLGKGDVAKKFAAAQANVQTMVLAQFEALLAQGGVSSTDLAALRSRMMNQLGTDLGADLARLPAEVVTYFYDFVDTQLASLERKGRMVAVSRSLDHLMSEVRGLHAEIASGAQKLRIGELLLRWQLTDLGAPELDEVARDYTRLVSELAYPVLTMRYPNALATLARDNEDDLDALRAVSINSTFEQQIDKLLNVGRALETVLGQNIEPADATRFVTIAVPRPDAPSDLTGNYRKVDKARATAFWSALTSGRSSPLDIFVTDLYADKNRSEKADTVSCLLSAPIINAMGIYGFVPGNSSAPGWNNENYAADVRFAPQLVFPTFGGPIRYEVADLVSDEEEEAGGSWLTAVVPMAFGDELSGISTNKTAWNGLHVGSGLSPFTHLQISWHTVDSSYLRQVQAVFLSFEVSTRQATVANWLTTCPTDAPQRN